VGVVTPPGNCPAAFVCPRRRPGDRTFCQARRPGAPVNAYMGTFMARQPIEPETGGRKNPWPKAGFGKGAAKRLRRCLFFFFFFCVRRQVKGCRRTGGGALGRGPDKKYQLALGSPAEMCRTIVPPARRVVRGDVGQRRRGACQTQTGSNLHCRCPARRFLESQEACLEEANV